MSFNWKKKKNHSKNKLSDLTYSFFFFFFFFLKYVYQLQVIGLIVNQISGKLGFLVIFFDNIFQAHLLLYLDLSAPEQKALKLILKYDLKDFMKLIVWKFPEKLSTLLLLKIGLDISNKIYSCHPHSWRRTTLHQWYNLYFAVWGQQWSSKSCLIRKTKFGASAPPKPFQYLIKL